MKRTIIAAALIAGAFMSAHADYAASDNIYGIINVPIVAGMNAVGVSLLPMDPAADRLHDVILPEGLTAGNSSTGDGLWLYGATYDKYYLAAGNVWTNGSVGPAATLGMGAWIKAAAPATIYQVGIVTNVATVEIPTAATGHSFIANPFPADLVVDGVGAMIDWSETAAWNKNALSGDRLLIWTGTKYDTYYYFNNGNSEIDGWYSADNKGRRPPTIPAGEGFFFQRKTEDADWVEVQNPLD
ncbi:MAG: hypothetical protein PHW08_03450 [Kiritimatiellae bacterium]|nr:hypothetical protein [Kiritimatiellia bacterium]